MRPLDKYVRWALKQERYMLWGFWIPLAVMIVIAFALYLVIT